MPTNTPEAAMSHAKEVAGGRNQLAKRLTTLTGKTVTPQGVGQWKVCPAARVIQVETVTEVPRHELRPDIYPPPLVEPKKRKGA